VRISSRSLPYWWELDIGPYPRHTNLVNILPPYFLNTFEVRLYIPNHLSFSNFLTKILFPCSHHGTIHLILLDLIIRCTSPNFTMTYFQLIALTPFGTVTSTLTSKNPVLYEWFKLKPPDFAFDLPSRYRVIDSLVIWQHYSWWIKWDDKMNMNGKHIRIGKVLADVADVWTQNRPWHFEIRGNNPNYSTATCCFDLLIRGFLNDTFEHRGYVASN
jgi:hypothetical protein